MLVAIAAWTDKRRRRLVILAMIAATAALVVALAWLLRVSKSFK